MNCWTLNKKIDDKVKELKEYVYFLGGKVYDLEAEVNHLKGKKDGKGKKDSKRDA